MPTHCSKDMERNKFRALRLSPGATTLVCTIWQSTLLCGDLRRATLCLLVVDLDLVEAAWSHQLGSESWRWVGWRYCCQSRPNFFFFLLSLVLPSQSCPNCVWQINTRRFCSYRLIRGKAPGETVNSKLDCHGNFCTAVDRRSGTEFHII